MLNGGMVNNKVQRKIPIDTEKGQMAFMLKVRSEWHSVVERYKRDGVTVHTVSNAVLQSRVKLANALAKFLEMLDNEDETVKALLLNENFSRRPNCSCLMSSAREK